MWFHLQLNDKIHKTSLIKGVEQMDTVYLLNSLWVMISAVLVILMIGGFILLETGSTRMKNAGHIAGKTILTFGISSIVFWAVGYGLIFGEGNSILGFSDFFYSGYDVEGLGLSGSVFFLFQLAFAGISITIAFGGFAERAKLSVYVVFALLFSVLVYPFIAHWIWGGGWLAEHGKQDFAGSTVVHLTGAMAALAATLLLKPRLGKYNQDGSANKIEGHNLVFTALSVLFLWVGWFGFNAGSTVSVDGAFFGFVALNTNLAAAAGTIAALAISWIVMGKADIPMMLNGTLAGLVAITASCAFVDTWAAVLIGLVAGILVFYSIRFFESKKIDDPIFALSVHGAAGVWGTLSTGFFATPELATVGKPGLFYGGGFDQLGVQALGVLVSGAFAFIVSYLILLGMKTVMNGLRVTEEEENIGLDISEHGNYGYPEFVSIEATIRESSRDHRSENPSLVTQRPSIN
jgi:ammonium transporter, Amt family